MKRYFLILISLLFIFGCKDHKEKAVMEKDISKDIHSYAQPAEAVVQHLSLNLDVDFDSKIIHGIAVYQIDKSEGADSIVFDTRDLDIKRFLGGGKEVEFTLNAPEPHMGSALKIPVTSSADKVSIHYVTSPQAGALQWLNPQQTAGKTDPFLFTQSQAILARTWIPIQDSPGIRFTYEAKVKVPEGLMALMSAENPTEINEDGLYSFKMEQPIPSYLMALAVGNLQFAPLVDRAGVYAEPELIEKAAWEFAEVEDMIRIAEELYGPYRWGRYDMIVLPPSFPFGGMENPRLTFATPTIIAEDRSLTSLIAHELAHSWSGNLVTNATWNDFWLNEGFTVYFEYRIMEALNGKDYSEMLAALSLQDLKKEVASFIDEGKGKDTRLMLDLSGRDPDEGVSSIAYDKGYFFLRYLENLVGREKWDAFLKQYFEAHAFQVMDTKRFLAYLKAGLFEKNGIEYPEKEIQEWIFESGLPESLPAPDSDRFDKVDQAINNWLKGTPATEIDTTEWSTHEWLHFLRNLPDQMNIEQMNELDKAFGFTATNNAEILDAWFIHTIRHQYAPAYAKMDSFLVNTGRRKFLTPLYTEMAKTEKGKVMAEEIYLKARPNYHYVSVHTIDKVLKWQERNSE
jgi:leukotriene-A4 hydrolase